MARQPEKAKKAVAKAKTDAKAPAKKKPVLSAVKGSPSRNILVKRAAFQTFLHRKEQRELKAVRAQALLTGNFFLEPEAKVFFVIRIRGVNDMPPKAKKILALLRLRRIFTGVFIKVNKSTIEMLRRVAPWVTWGTPSVETVRKLLLKRGFAKVRGQRIKLDNNQMVQDNMGSKNVISIEDIIHELYTCGSNFREVNNWLWPFRLSCPRGGLRKKRVHFVEGGDYGNRESFINPFVKSVL